MLQHLKIGHKIDREKGTGVTVFLFEKSAPCAYHLCGCAPATRDVALLDPAATVEKVDALVFSGGSAFGLGVTDGVMQWLKEQNRGFRTPHGVVPIVPTAAIFDLAVISNQSPTAEDAYLACTTVSSTLESGRLGAGYGASVGKMVANAYPMSGGFGYAQLSQRDGLQVLACAVVNSLGDVIDEKGEIIAGASLDGKFVNCQEHLLSGKRMQKKLMAHNTTLVAVFTNAGLSIPMLTRVAKMASGGMARAISPVFTRFDGDIIFAAALGQQDADELVVGVMAVEATRRAIVNAVKNSVVLL